MKKILLSLVVASSMFNVYASGDLHEVISSSDAPLVNKTYYKLKRKWYSTKSGFSASVGTWYVNWDQTSTSNNMLQNQNDALDVSYDIDPSVAAVLTLKANYKLLSVKAEYYSTGITAKDDQEVSGFNLGLSVVDVIPYMDTEFRVNSANFKGGIEATKKSDGSNISPSSGTFETQVNIYDFIVYPFNKYLGVGYRKYKYDLPQDVYLVKNSDNTVLINGLIDVEYSGDFITIALDNKRLKEEGFLYSAIVGIGQFTPSAEGYDKYLEEQDAKFAELFVGYGVVTNKRGLRLSLTGGYKYNKIQTDAKLKDNEDYTLMTQFDTEFHGPFVQITIIY